MLTLTKGNTFSMSKFLISVILKPFHINRFTLKSKSDVIGAFASGLCMAHCITTPFLFIASACSASCCNTSPIWWQWLDYFFLFVSLFAVYQGSKSSTKLWVSSGLWVNWIVLFFFPYSFMSKYLVRSIFAFMIFCFVYGMGGAFISLLLSKTIAKWTIVQGGPKKDPL